MKLSKPYRIRSCVIAGCLAILALSSGCASGPVVRDFCLLYELDPNPVSNAAVNNNATYLCKCPNDAPEDLKKDLCE